METYTPDRNGIPTIKKTVPGSLDYSFDFTAWLAAIADTATAYQITTPAGITKVSDMRAAGVVTVWLAGGTVGSTYQVKCRITTNAGRVDERTINVQVVAAR